MIFPATWFVFRKTLFVVPYKLKAISHQSIDQEFLRFYTNLRRHRMEQGSWTQRAMIMPSAEKIIFPATQFVFRKTRFVVPYGVKAIN
jgi:hypothetical protein